MRQDRSADVTIYTKSKDVSYAGCGLPYYVGGAIDNYDSLIVNTPEKFSSLTGAKVKTGEEAVAVDTASKTVTFRNTESGVEETDTYDKLIIATGAEPVVPDIDGVNLPGVFCVRTPDDAKSIRDYIEQNHCRSAVVAGSGFIGWKRRKICPQRDFP